MNLILLEATDFIESNSHLDNKALLTPPIKTIHGRVLLDDYRAQHILTILNATVGDQLSVGLHNGPIGKATILTIDKQTISLSVELDKAPPPKLPVKLFIALPRPKVARRLIETCTELGVKEIHLINAYKVEKSYWQSPLLESAKINQQILAGLQQSKDTVLPKVYQHKLFKPFVEDTLPELIDQSTALVAHPYANNQHTVPPLTQENEVTLCIGPEGGFIPYEIAQLENAGCQALSLGSRIFRVETVLPYLLGKMF